MLHNEARKLLIQALEKTHNAREVAEKGLSQILCKVQTAIKQKQF